MPLAASAHIHFEISSSTPPGVHYIFGDLKGSKRLTTFSAMRMAMDQPENIEPRA